MGGAASGKVKPGFWIRIRMLKFRLPYFQQTLNCFFEVLKRKVFLMRKKRKILFLSMLSRTCFKIRGRFQHQDPDPYYEYESGSEYSSSMNTDPFRIRIRLRKEYLALSPAAGGPIGHTLI